MTQTFGSRLLLMSKRGLSSFCQGTECFLMGDRMYYVTGQKGFCYLSFVCAWDYFVGSCLRRLVTPSSKRSMTRSKPFAPP